MILRPDLARVIFEIGVVKFGKFRLKHHEKNPGAPLSPIKFMFRRPPQGPLTDGFIRQLGSELLPAVAGVSNLESQVIVGVPRAGDLLATAFASVTGLPQFNLDKEEYEDRRLIIPGLLKERMAELGIALGSRALLIDDVVTRATSKLEAISALRSCDLDVRDVLICVDLEQGGRETLEVFGVKLHAAWRLTELLDFYLSCRLFSQQKYEEAMSYLKTNRL